MGYEARPIRVNTGAHFLQISAILSQIPAIYLPQLEVDSFNI